MADRSNFRRGPGRPSRAEVYARLDDAVTDLRKRLGGLRAPIEARSSTATAARVGCC